MAFTQEQITSLESAIASGTLTVRYGDRQVTYHSLKEMRSLLTQMRSEVGASIGVRPRRRTMRLFQSGTGNG
ncbi:hypothetical protein KIP31_10085 [Xanthomonas campestris pv. campestris]|jgi:hypothetical protein|uniref:phage head-tail joining protein n=1 Tax=Xanthomonas TaxID=338 RepID=UPI000CED92A0|nr:MULTISPECIES: hypothetical protein [Xanthomonas]MCF8799249.1 hypothetical protein [Xanthomonas campestris pv. campestris]MCF8809666.1 hypothetical protein [Xanthomonas campestris pv. campestris]MCF8815780.1 hypothetical protein [Xanthomonas campestris pv. campestris]MDM7674520.1 hypothetical protein [Xanthomonas campestris pv. campestris]MEA9569639.1 hypothetical protein [Xanthomonas campestris]